MAGRGDATRERLLHAALELFGKCGFEGVGARDIAARAGVPLGAIPYHFGTKEVLYRQVLEQVSSELRAALSPAVSDAAAGLTGTPEEAARALTRFQGALAHVLAATPEAEGWAKLLLREHLDPTSAYDLVYADGGRDAVELIARLIARATGREPDDEAVLLEAFARMGEALAFRTLQAAIMRRLGWSGMGEREAQKIADMLERRVR